MTTKSPKQFTELEFDQIKDSLKFFLSQQDQFKDYDFEGSNINTLLDVLAYNTQYNAFYSNMWFTEHFIDVAQLRSSVVGIARNLGYVPRSAKSSSATIKIDLTPVAGHTGDLVTPARTAFSGTNVDGETFVFELPSVTTVAEDSGVWSTEIEIKEGAFYRYAETISGDNGVVLPISNVDTDRITVFVKGSVAATTGTEYEKSTDYTKLTGSDLVYFIQEAEDEKHRIYFGDDVVGAKVSDGNQILVEYYATSGAAPNGINTFDLDSSIPDVAGYEITTITSPAGGREIETINSIRTAAPLFYQAQNRAVTPEDYKVIIKANFSEVEDVIAWGGEGNVPADYGVVYISLKTDLDPTDPVDKPTLDALKEEIKTSLIENYAVVSVFPKIVDPRVIDITVLTEVFYDSFKANPGGSQIHSDVLQTILDYSNENLGNFGSSLLYSRLVRDIDDSNSSIINSNTDISVRIYVGDDAESFGLNDYTFLNGIEKETLRSSVFSYDDTTGPTATNYTDVIFKDVGTGEIELFDVSTGSDVATTINVGSIDYTTGIITFYFDTTFDITKITDYKNGIYVSAITEDFDVFVENNYIIDIASGNINVSVTDTRTNLTYEV